jgi:hypothetical protein
VVPLLILKNTVAVTQTKNIPIRLNRKELSKIPQIPHPVFQDLYATIGIEGGAALSPEMRDRTNLSGLSRLKPV